MGLRLLACGRNLMVPSEHCSSRGKGSIQTMKLVSGLGLGAQGNVLTSEPISKLFTIYIT